MLSSLAEVLWTARYDYPQGWRLERHEHEYFQMICFLSGKGTMTLRETETPIATGLAVLVKPGEMHGLSAESLVKTLDMKFAIRNRALRKLVLAAASFIETGVPELIALFERVRFEGEQRAFLYREMCAAFLTEILIVALRQGRQSAVVEAVVSEKQQRAITDQVTRSVLSMVHERYAEDITVESIAKELGYSERHVRGRFHAMTGISPSDYLMRYRVEKARELIEFSDYAIKEIAGMAGFKSVHHFTRVFARAMHAPPAHWRQTYREGVRKDVCIRPDFANVIWTQPSGQSLPVKTKATPSGANKG